MSGLGGERAAGWACWAGWPNSSGSGLTGDSLAKDVPGKMLPSDGNGSMESTFDGVVEGEGKGDTLGSRSFEELAVVLSDDRVGVESCVSCEDDVLSEIKRS